VSIEYFDMPWDRPESYSAAVSSAGLIFTSGHLGAEPGGDPVPFREQARTALERLLATIQRAGGTAETIIKVNAYLATISDFAEWDEIYRSMISTHPMPARTSVEIGGFAEPLLLEVDAVAVATRTAGGDDGV
jgi:2-iminobutanoate/2-iminopropanoate deaminase